MLGTIFSTVKVIIDTNMFLEIGKNGIDVFTEIDRLMEGRYNLCVVEGTIEELERIMTEKKGIKGSDKFNAKLGFIMLKQKNLKVLPVSSDCKIVDDGIVENTDKSTFVATLDRGLQRRVKEKEGKILTIRQHKYFIIQ